jgi:hypothetical protein
MVSLTFFLLNCMKSYLRAMTNYSKYSNVLQLTPCLTITIFSFHFCDVVAHRPVSRSNCTRILQIIVSWEKKVIEFINYNKRWK